MIFRISHGLKVELRIALVIFLKKNLSSLDYLFSECILFRNILFKIKKIIIFHLFIFSEISRRANDIWFDIVVVSSFYETFSSLPWKSCYWWKRHCFRIENKCSEEIIVNYRSYFFFKLFCNCFLFRHRRKLLRNYLGSIRNFSVF